MSRLWSILSWSVIAAAFIGPGTVTAAASAGAGYRYALLWALLFSTLACLLLQEASARLTVVSGQSLGRALRTQYRGGLSGAVVLVLVLGAVVLGCAAYEAGNILGGAAGAALGTGLDPRLATVTSGLLAAVLLWVGRPQTVARILGAFVAVMGLAFLYTAWRLGPAPLDLLRGAVVPTVPKDSSLLVLGLIGTTVVPYNLFLGSELAHGQKLSDLRFGLTVSVLFGGLISMGVLVVGSSLDGSFSFEALAVVLAERLGPWARSMFAGGLYAAGLSSAITAPLAAAITARSVLGGRQERSWGNRSWRFRSVWAGVLAIGVGFGLAGVQPIPAILLAQALNGVLLPLVAVFLLLAVNDVRLMGRPDLNGRWANVAFMIVVGATIVLGVTGITRAAAAAAGLGSPGEGTLLLLSAVVAAMIGWPITRRLVDRDRRQ
jgi:Mn2+/Fe2+ NRAMP family transporter